MQSLLAQFNRNPSARLALRIRAYHRAYPMAECLLLPADLATLQRALQYVSAA